ncbi:hypothetical protein BCEN4_1560023 [Burkholderia cenocepacia]|nr:hypothetical protein BCEN4_1560023 [Burkholderia cenocepacia]
MRLRRPPSSLYTFLAGYREAWLGVASMRASGVSPNLKGSAPTVSGRALNRLSPLCLPISSPRQEGGRDSTIACACVPSFRRAASRHRPSSHRLLPRIRRRYRTDATRPTISSHAATSADTIDRASFDGLNRLTFVSCLSRNKRRVRHREVTNVFDNSPAENVYIA